jgi:HrpA-like RNA helicase
MKEDTAPEIQRCNLTTLIMTIKALGVANVLSFELMSVPSVEALSFGLESLYALGAIDDATELTALGREMVYFPTDNPYVSRMILASLDMESREDTPSMVAKLVVSDVLTVAAALQVRNLLYQPRTERQWRMYDDAMADILDRSGDHVTMVHLFDLVDHSNKMLSEDECRDRFVNRVALQRALDVRNQLTRFLRRRFGGGYDWFGSARREIVGSHVFDPQERSDAIRNVYVLDFS